MKKFAKTFIILCLLITIITTLVACDTTGTNGKDNEGRYKLLVPEVTINNNTISWEGIRYCEEYGIVINGEKEITTKNTYFTLLDYDEAKVKVRAIGDDVKTVSSDYSKEISYKSKAMLKTPELEIEDLKDENKIRLKWNVVEGAESYRIMQETTINSENDNKTLGTTNDTEYFINKSDISTPDVYNFKVQAVGKENTIDSNWSNNETYTVKEELKTPEVKYDDGGKMSWEKVDNATSYNIGIKKVGDANDVFVEKITKTYYYSQDILDAIAKYCEEKNLDSQVGEYEIYIQAINENHSDVFLNSKKVQPIKETDSTTIKFVKPGKVENIQLNGDKLTWESNEEDVVYKLTMTSGEQSLFEDNIETTKFDLSTKINEDKNANYAGKVFNISVAVQGDLKNGIFDGESAYYMNGDVKGEYCYIPKTLETIQDGEFAGYYKVDSVGALAYMLCGKEPNGKYLLTSDIDGKNANVYAGTGVFNGVFNGNNHIIKNINFIASSNASKMAMFGEVAKGTELKNFTISKCNIVNESANVTEIAFIAGVNNGLIDMVNVINSNINYATNVAGLVGVNNGEIKRSSLMSSKLNAKGKVAGIALVNNGTIFNASVYNNELTSTYVVDDKEEKADLTIDTYAGGVTVENNGSILNSFVRECKITATSNNELAIAGGITAILNGKIKECYVDNLVPTSLFVQANNDNAKDAYAGALVGKAIKGEIKSCYAFGMKIVANSVTKSVASGIVAIKESEEQLTINDIFVAHLGIHANKKVMICAKNDSVSSNRVYYDAKSVSIGIDYSNGVKKQNSEMLTLEIEGFVKPLNGDITSHMLLKNMMYSFNNQYKIEYKVTEDTRTIQVYFAGSEKQELTTKPKYPCDLKEEGFKCDIFEAELANGEKVVLPIYISVIK